VGLIGWVETQLLRNERNREQQLREFSFVHKVVIIKKQIKEATVGEEEHCEKLRRTK
jgi:hypothetical protein